MKKRFLSLALAGLMAVSLAACGGSGGGGTSTGGGDSSGDSGSSSSGDALQVVIWDTNQQAGIQEICDDFTAETGIEAKVEVKDWDSYWTLLESAASGGDLPDVFWMHSNNSQMYMKNEMLLQLDDYIANSDKIDLANYMPEVTELYTMDDKHYAIPKDYDTIALWYNKTMFDEAGLSYPDETWSYDDLLDAAAKLTKDDGSQYGFCMNPSNDQDTWYNFVYANDGYIVSDDHKSSGFDNDKTLEAMDYVSDLLQYCPDSTTMSETGTDVMFQSGQVAMITQGSWMIAGFKDNDYLKENCDIAIIPYNKNTGKRVSIINGLGWAAAANTDRPDDCWKLLEWFGSEEMQKKQADLGVTMSAFEGTSENWINSTDIFNLDGYMAVTEPKTGDAENELVLRPYTYNSTVWSQESHEVLRDPWANPGDHAMMEQTCKDFAEWMNGKIAEENN